MKIQLHKKTVTKTENLMFLFSDENYRMVKKIESNPLVTFMGIRCDFIGKWKVEIVYKNFEKEAIKHKIMVQEGYNLNFILKESIHFLKELKKGDENNDKRTNSINSRKRTSILHKRERRDNMSKRKNISRSKSRL
jgi:hypothetical protein